MRTAENLSYLAEGTVRWSEAGISFDELRASGYFAQVTAEHRLKAAEYFARFESKRAPAQLDLFA